MGGGGRVEGVPETRQQHQARLTPRHIDRHPVVGGEYSLRVQQVGQRRSLHAAHQLLRGEASPSVSGVGGVIVRVGGRTGGSAGHRISTRATHWVLVFEEMIEPLQALLQISRGRSRDRRTKGVIVLPDLLHRDPAD